MTAIRFIPRNESTPTPTPLCNTVTLAEIQALITLSGLTCGNLYTITDPFTNVNGYGTITVLATSSNSVSPNATWNRPAHGLSIGGIIFNQMAMGNSIDQVRLGLLDLMVTPVPFNTTMLQTMTDLAAEINANTGTTGITALNTNEGIILINTVIDTTYNGIFPGAAVTGFAGAKYNIQMNFGEDTTSPSLQLPCVYDVSNAKLISVYDYRYNNTISQNANDDDCIFLFPFNFNKIGDSIFVDSLLNYNSIATDAFSLSNVYFFNVSIYQFLYQNTACRDTKINSYEISIVDGEDFTILNSNIVYPSATPGLFQGSIQFVLFNNVFNDGISYSCSGTITFDGSQGGGQVGTPVFLQTSPDNFCYSAFYLTNAYGTGITSGGSANISIGTNTTPTGLIKPSAYVGFNAVNNFFGDGITNDPFGNFELNVTSADITAGTLTYVICGFLAP